MIAKHKPLVRSWVHLAKNLKLRSFVMLFSALPDEEQLANIFIRAVKNVIDLVNLPSEKVIRLNRVKI